MRTDIELLQPDQKNGQETKEKRELCTAVTFLFDRHTGETIKPKESDIFQNANDYMKADIYLDIRDWAEVERKECMNKKELKIKNLKSTIESRNEEIRALKAGRDNQILKIKNLNLKIKELKK